MHFFFFLFHQLAAHDMFPTSFLHSLRSRAMVTAVLMSMLDPCRSSLRLLTHVFDCLPLLLVPSMYNVAMHDSIWQSISFHSSHVAEPCHPSLPYLVNYYFSSSLTTTFLNPLNPGRPASKSERKFVRVGVSEIFFSLSLSEKISARV